jgi:hypothetical protein
MIVLPVLGPWDWKGKKANYPVDANYDFAVFDMKTMSQIFFCHMLEALQCVFRNF